MKNHVLERQKRYFLATYNPTGDTDVAISKALNASILRNSPYLTDSQSIRSDIRAAWREWLLPLKQRYQASRGFDDVLTDMDRMRRDMLARFAGDVEIATSHAQKSISVFLKHLWCAGAIEEPPVCPVDREVFKLIYKYPLPAWTKMTPLCYPLHIKKITEIAIAEGQTIATWELLRFNSEAMRRVRCDPS